MRKLILAIFIILNLAIAFYCLSNEKLPHPLVRESKCNSCHDGLAKPTIQTCEKCHTKYKLGRSHPVGSGITDPNTNQTMTCTSTCHKPHGTGYKYQLPYKNNMELCLSCHKDF